MEFTFDEKAKNALNELIENSSEEYVRIRCFMDVEDKHRICRSRF